MLAAFIGFAYPSCRPVRVVYTLGDLPLALERVAVAAQSRKRAWLAWIDDRHVRFVAGEIVHLDGHEECNARGLWTFFHDDNGRLLASATWARDAEGSWHLRDR